MRDQVGKWIAAGVAIGIEDNGNVINRAIQGIAGSLNLGVFDDVLTIPPIKEPKLPKMNATFNEQFQQKNNTPINIIMDGRQVGRGVAPHIVNEIRQKTGIKFN
jgi:hypothetical protein